MAEKVNTHLQEEKSLFRYKKSKAAKMTAKFVDKCDKCDKYVINEFMTIEQMILF